MRRLLLSVLLLTAPVHADTSAPRRHTAPAASVTGTQLLAAATTALERGDVDEAQFLAMHAAARPGRHAFAAKVLYGDCLLRRGEDERALHFFTALRAIARETSQRTAVDTRLTSLTSRGVDAGG